MILEPLRRLILEIVAPHRYFGVYEYRVLAAVAGRLNVGIVDPLVGLDNMIAVEVRPGMLGGKGTPAVGSLVLVSFINGDRARPFIAHVDETAPTDNEVDATLDTTIGHSIPASLPDSLGRHLCVGDWITVPGIGGIPLVLNAASPSMASTKRKALPGP